MWETVPGWLSATMGPSVYRLSGRIEGGGADEIPGWCGGTLRVGEDGDSGHRLHAERVVVHLHRCEGGRVVLAVLFPRRSRLHCVNDLEKGLKRGGEFCIR